MPASGLRLHLKADFEWLDNDAPRQRLWTALAQCSPAHRLQLRVEHAVDWETEASNAERQVLAAISCRLLVLNLWGECHQMLQPLARLAVRAD